MGVLISTPAQLAALQTSFGSYDIAEIYSAADGQEFFMNIPRRYIVKSVLRLLLLAFVIALFSYRLFAVVLVPCYVIFFFKTYVFASWCRAVNISQIKIWVFFSVMLILFEIAAIFLRKMFGQMF